jgi:hypothetical protein
MRLGNGTLADLALRLGKQEYSPARAAGAVSERAYADTPNLYWPAKMNGAHRLARCASRG